MSSGLSAIVIFTAEGISSPPYLTPATFITRSEVLGGDPHRWEDYFIDLITNTPLQVQTVALSLSMFSLLPLPTITKFKNVQRLASLALEVGDMILPIFRPS